ncbi:MAG: NTP transferase domain-containing protein [Pseudomonadota bacterium]|nr:NTP transferase domain-containing protein [Pseudomonadota bacterium]
MSPEFQAVILAAGRGSRLGAHTADLPKALLPIGPRSLEDRTETSFLRRQVEVLRARGVGQITVVVGYRKETVLAELARWGSDVQVVVNPTPEIRTSGSLHSLQFAARSPHAVLDGTKQMLFMDADIVYDPSILDLLLGGPAENALLVSGVYVDGSEEVLVYGTPERPRFLAKGLTEELAGATRRIGEAVGIVKLAPADHGLARRTLDWLLGDPDAPEGSAKNLGFGPGRRGTEHEELTQRFMHYGRMQALVFGPELAFMEVDSPDEYARCRQEMYPRLLAEEARRGGRASSGPA